MIETVEDEQILMESALELLHETPVNHEPFPGHMRMIEDWTVANHAYLSVLTLMFQHASSGKVKDSSRVAGILEGAIGHALFLPNATAPCFSQRIAEILFLLHALDADYALKLLSAKLDLMERQHQEETYAPVQQKANLRFLSAIYRVFGWAYKERGGDSIDSKIRDVVRQLADSDVVNSRGELEEAFVDKESTLISLLKQLIRLGHLSLYGQNPLTN
jgi:hypothetical protein